MTSVSHGHLSSYCHAWHTWHMRVCVFIVCMFQVTIGNWIGSFYPILGLSTAARHIHALRANGEFNAFDRSPSQSPASDTFVKQHSSAQNALLCLWTCIHSLRTATANHYTRRRGAWPPAEQQRAVIYFVNNDDNWKYQSKLNRFILGFDDDAAVTNKWAVCNIHRSCFIRSRV